MKTIMDIDDMLEEELLKETMYQSTPVNKILTSIEGQNLFTELLLALYSQHCSHSLIPEEQHEEIITREVQKLIDNQYTL